MSNLLFVALVCLGAVEFSFAVLRHEERWRGPDGIPSPFCPCDDNPCLNGGTCIDLSTLYRSFKNDDGFICKCRSTFTGRTCETPTIVPPVIIDITPKVELNPGDDIELRCNAIGNPTPTITWRRGATIVTDSRTTVLQEDGLSLTLCDVGCYDTGVYTCVAENRAGLDQETTQVTLRADAFDRVAEGDSKVAELAVQSLEEVINSINETLVYYANHPDPTSPQDLWRKHHWPSASTTAKSTRRDAFELVILTLGLISRPLDPPRTSPVCPADTEVCPTGHLFGGYCYNFFTHRRNFFEAKQECFRQGTILSELDSREQLDFLRKIILSDPYLNRPENEFWVAALNDEPEKQPDEGWKFAFTGREIPNDDTYWNKAEPTFAPNQKFPFNCGRLANTLAGRQRYNMDDRECSNKFGYICRKPTTFNRYNFLLSPTAQELVSEITGCIEREEPISCNDCEVLNYRTFDGQCNNIGKPLLGAAGTPFKRNLHAKYEDGICEPQGWNPGLLLYNGFDKPSARLVANELAGTLTVTPDVENSYLTMQWAQFLDHDITLAPMSPSMTTFESTPRNCTEVNENIQPCFPIQIPEGDPRLARGQTFISFPRSAAICGSGSVEGALGCLSPREQVNEITAFVDGSMIYGSNEEIATLLRDPQNPYLLVSNSDPFVTDPSSSNIVGEMPPFDDRVEIDCARPLDASVLAAPNAPIDCFACGDIRCNEQILLLTMHVIWFREHNRVARFLHDLNPHWDDEKVFQTARKIVYAQLEKITYDDYLPIVIGRFGQEVIGKYKGYDASVDPSIANSFATGAFRYGHGLVNPSFSRLEEDLSLVPAGRIRLSDTFFAPFNLFTTGLDPLLRGLYAVPHKKMNPSEVMNIELQDNLFRLAFEDELGLDLAALNIQRGRDHGLPSYNEFREFAGLGFADRFGDLKNEISNATIRRTLRKLYGDPSNIDLWIGGMLEDPLKDGKVGPTFAFMIAEQFQRIRDGDRFWYENPGVFTSDQLAQIRLSSLSRVICDNGENIREIQPDAFALIQSRNDFVPCRDIRGPDLTVFKDCEECAELSYPTVSADYTREENVVSKF